MKELFNNYFKNILYAASAIVAILGAVFAILKFWKGLKSIFNRKYMRSLAAYHLISEWYEYIDENLNDLNLDKVNHLEEKIDHYFRQNNVKRAYLNFTRTFRKKFLREIGSMKNDIESFKNYARLELETLPVKLYSKNLRKSVRLEKFPFELYWWKIRGNFWIFYKNYKRQNDNLPVDESPNWANINMPFFVLKRYFKQS